MKLPYLSTAAAILVAVNVASAEPKRSPLAPGINELNYKVLNEFNKKDKDKNIFMSSFSIHAALSMAYNGADGATKAELGKLLGISERVTLERLADTWSELRTDLEKADRCFRRNRRVPSCELLHVLDAGTNRVNILDIFFNHVPGKDISES